ncbi:MAG: pantetheine-phosphate adenylyltransferase [Lentisphaeria bacterium]
MIERLAIYPGSFDPPTNGHLDVVKRAAQLFDKVIVAVANNGAKQPMFTAQERVELLTECCAEISNVEVDYFSGLLYQEARKLGAAAVVRGLRAVSDFEWEFQMALMNRELDRNCETVFLMPSPKYSFVSSTMIKEISAYGGDISSFVPECVMNALKNRIKKEVEV